MTDKEKLEAIRTEIHRLVDVRGYDREMANDLFTFMDSLPNEPVSEELEEAAIRSAMLKKDIPKEHLHEYPYNEYGRRKFIEGVQWQKTKDESTTEDLGEYINELSKQFPEVSFAKLSRIAVRVSKWQKEQFEKNRLAACDRQTEEEAEIESDFVMGIIEKEHRQPTFDDAIKYGMRLQKEQMMAKAIEGGCFSYRNGYVHISCDIDEHLTDIKFGDKVKVIVIKED